MLFFSSFSIIAQNIQQCWFLRWLFSSKITKLILSLWCLQLHVNVEKGHPKSLLDIGILLLQLLLQNFLVVLVAEDGDFTTAVTVEDAEEGLVFIVVEFTIGYVCVFLGKVIDGVRWRCGEAAMDKVKCG